VDIETEVSIMSERKASRKVMGQLQTERIARHMQSAAPMGKQP
jgi:hypothetical protein